MCNKIDATKPKITTWGRSWQGRCKRAVCQRRFQAFCVYGRVEHGVASGLQSVVDVFKVSFDRRELPRRVRRQWLLCRTSTINGYVTPWL